MWRWMVQAPSSTAQNLYWSRQEKQKGLNWQKKLNTIVISALKETKKALRYLLAWVVQEATLRGSHEWQKGESRQKGRGRVSWCTVNRDITWKMFPTPQASWGQTWAGSSKLHPSSLNLAFSLIDSNSFSSSRYQFLHLYNGANICFDQGQLLLGKIKWENVIHCYLVVILLHLSVGRLKRA